MRFGIFTGMGNTTWDTVLDLWRHAAASGWDAACVTDHFMPNTPDRVGDTMECWTTLAALAAVVPRMRLGTIVSGNTYRHPAVLAKMAAQVDLISGGRLICGLGAAWQQNEHEAYGIPFYTVAERLARPDVHRALRQHGVADQRRPRRGRSLAHRADQALRHGRAARAGHGARRVRRRDSRQAGPARRRRRQHGLDSDDVPSEGPPAPPRSLHAGDRASRAIGASK